METPGTLRKFLINTCLTLRETRLYVWNEISNFCIILYLCSCIHYIIFMLFNAQVVSSSWYDYNNLKNLI